MTAVSTVPGELKALELHAMDRLASVLNSNTPDGLRFRALITGGGTERFELARAQGEGRISS
jgi:hypothetical protein